jgi:hypothetical protein
LRLEECDFSNTNFRRFASPERKSNRDLNPALAELAGHSDLNLS